MDEIRVDYRVISEKLQRGNPGNGHEKAQVIDSMRQKETEPGENPRVWIRNNSLAAVSQKVHNLSNNSHPRCNICPHA